MTKLVYVIMIERQSEICPFKARPKIAYFNLKKAKNECKLLNDIDNGFYYYVDRVKLEEGELKRR